MNIRLPNPTHSIHRILFHIVLKINSETRYGLSIYLRFQIQPLSKIYFILQFRLVAFTIKTIIVVKSFAIAKIFRLSTLMNAYESCEFVFNIFPV